MPERRRPEPAPKRVEVLVTGAVAAPGRQALVAPATLDAALAAAGGPVRQVDKWAAGPVTVRRPRPGGVRVWRLHLERREEPAWRRLRLRSGDVVVLQWHIPLGA